MRTRDKRAQRSRDTHDVQASAQDVQAATLPKTWSNPEGLVLRQVSPTVFAAERPFVWQGIDVGGRMAVVKLQDGSLWVHSPVNLDEELKQQLAKIGPVKHVVSPNYEHVKYAQQWIDAYPSATSYACPGLKEKEPHIKFSNTVGAGNTAPASWPSEIEFTYLDYEHNPFFGNPFFNEVVFCHKPSKTLFVTDLFWNYPDDVPLGTKLWKLGMDKVYQNFYLTFMIKDKRAFRTAMDRLFSQNWENILPCHGSYVEKSGKQALRKFLSL